MGVFTYSHEESTRAHDLVDDVPEEVKGSRLTEIIHLQSKMSLANNKSYIGKTVRVLADSVSKKSEHDLAGRNDQNSKVVFPKGHYKMGDFVNVLIERVTTTSLIGTVVP